MSTIFLILSICTNIYLFYKFLKERNERIALTYTYNKEEYRHLCIKNKLEDLKETNDKLQARVEYFIKRKEERNAQL